MGRVRPALLAKFISISNLHNINRTTIAAGIRDKTAIQVIKSCCKVLSIPTTRNCNLDDLCTLVENHIIALMSSPQPFQSKLHNTIDSIMMIVALWIETHMGRHRLWCTFAVLTHYVSIYDISKQWKRKGHRREILRHFPPDIQNIILNHLWQDNVWKQHNMTVYSILRGWKNEVGYAAVYCKWCDQQRKHYIGKANYVRSSHATCKHYSGIFARLKEHMQLTYKLSRARSAEQQR